MKVINSRPLNRLTVRSG